MEMMTNVFQLIWKTTVFTFEVRWLRGENEDRLHSIERQANSLSWKRSSSQFLHRVVEKNWDIRNICWF